jgi:phage-related protein
VSSVTFCGRELSPYVSAEVEWPAAHTLVAETARVPGRPGLALLSADVEPLELRVRLHLDAPEALTSAERAEVRRTVRAWLLADGGGTLVVPGEPGLEWHDVVCAGSTGWPTPLADASATVTFLCLDPIAYGAERSSADDAFEVGGSWPTRPVVEMTATAGSGASVACAATGERVELARTLSAGDLVRVDCAAQTVAVNGVDATADVTLGSDFPSLAPGRAALSFSGCSSHLVLWRERWA